MTIVQCAALFYALAGIISAANAAHGWTVAGMRWIDLDALELLQAKPGAFISEEFACGWNAALAWLELTAAEQSIRREKRERQKNGRRAGERAEI